MNIDAIREDFPALKRGATHFDGPGGSQIPLSVANAVFQVLSRPMANRGVNTIAEQNSERTVLEARQAICDLLGGVSPAGVIFGRSFTHVTYELARVLMRYFVRTKKNDEDVKDFEIVVSRLEHDSNIRPWMQAAAGIGCKTIMIDFDVETGEIIMEQLRNAMKKTTKLVCVTAASNILGFCPNIKEISSIVHSIPGCLFFVDGVHLTPHTVIDVKEMGCDFYGCSPYKFFGPHLACMYADPKLLETIAPDMEKLLPAPDIVPEKFELGTLPYELLAGVAAAVDYIASISSKKNANNLNNLNDQRNRRERIIESMKEVEEHEDKLCEVLFKGLSGIPGIKFYGRKNSKNSKITIKRTPTLFFSFEGHKSADIYKFLATKKNVNAPAGTFYALEACIHLGLGKEGALRAGLAPYNNLEDVNNLINGIKEYLKINSKL